MVPPGERIHVLCGYAEFPKEFLRPPRSLAERMYANITRWTRMERGGHFPALEQPAELAREIRAFFRTVRCSGGIISRGLTMRAKPPNVPVTGGWHRRLHHPCI